MATERRLIDADELLNQIDQADADVFDTPPPGYVSLGGDDWGYSYNTIARIVQNTPTVDAVEVVHGHWIEHSHLEVGGECSACGWQFQWFENNEAHYCPHCGAKMDGDGNG